MNATLLSLALLASGLLAVAVPASAAEPAPSTARVTRTVAPDPALQIRDLARLFQNGDIAGLVQAAVPPSKWTEIQLGYELARLTPTTDEQRAEFDEKLAQITGPHAVDDLMAEIEPKLEQARPQVPGALLMGFGAMQMAVASPESELDEAQRAALQAALPGIQRWATNTDFLSSDTLRDALTLLTDAARQAGVRDIDQLKAMPLDELLGRAGNVLIAAKQATLLYGIDLDAIADSLQVDVLEQGDTTARVRTTVTIFDAPVWSEHDLVLVEGRWYDRKALVKLSLHHDDVQGEG